MTRHSNLTDHLYAADFYQPLLRWFNRHKRDLPWRSEPRDPYHVWLAEVMLQQTQVATVIPYYQRWLQRFPTLQSLADAPLDDVLKVWEGLGYYSRARNLHHAAQVVMHDFAGQIPSTVEGLLKLPGVGRYTAGAIASLAFHQDAPILDGNVIRVLTRVFAIATDIKEPATIAKLWQLSESLLPRGRAGQFNEALMDFGATICTPHAPMCTDCPLHTNCTAYAKGNPEGYPVKRAKQPTPTRVVLTAVIMDAQGRMLLAQRPAKGLLGGLWEFPGGEAPSLTEGLAASPTRLEQMIRATCGLQVNLTHRDFIARVKHTFTHFHMIRHVAMIQLAHIRPHIHHSDQYTGLRWVTREEIAALALTRSDQKILSLIFDPPAHNRQLSFLEP